MDAFGFDSAAHVERSQGRAALAAGLSGAASTISSTIKSISLLDTGGGTTLGGSQFTGKFGVGGASGPSLADLSAGRF